MDPVPSVCLAQECTRLINACVVEDFGIAPNWLSPIFLRIDGRQYSATTNSSATIERMGSRCLFTSLIGFCFGIGTVSADFQEGGKRLSSKELLMISDIVSEMRSAFSFSNHAGIPSGLDAFLVQNQNVQNPVCG